MDIEHPAAKMIVEIAKVQEEEVGDGTTTATLLAQIITQAGMKNIAAGANPMVIKRGIEKAVEAVVDELKKIAKPIKGREEIREHWKSVVGSGKTDFKIESYEVVVLKIYPPMGEKKYDHFAFIVGTYSYKAPGEEKIEDPVFSEGWYHMDDCSWWFMGGGF